MARYSDVLRDEFSGRPVPGALITVANKDGSLAVLTDDYSDPLDNPFLTDALGRIAFNAADAVYDMAYRFGGRLVRSDDVIVGEPPEFAGPTGPSNNTRLTLALLKAASITDKTSLYDGSLWTWTLGNYTGQADDVNIVKADSTALSTGAWVRQSSDKLTFKSARAGARVRNARDKMSDIVSALDFGAIGDGNPHALSTRFASLAAAQAVHPFVASLSQQIDWAALQAALNSVENSGTLLIPPGHYRIGTDALQFPNYCTIQGASRGGDDLGFGALIESDSTTAAIFTNKYTSNVAFVQFRDLALRGGGYAIQVAGSVSCSAVTVERIDSRECAIDDLYFNRLEVSTIRDCFLLSGSRTGYAVNVAGFAQNSNYYVNNRCSAAGSGVWNAGQGAENITWTGGSWEGGGQSGEAAMTLEGSVVPVKNVRFFGVYFENIPEYLIRGDNFSNVVFDNCRMSGSASGGGLVASKFDVGSNIVGFGSNDWNEGTIGYTAAPANVLIMGRNDGLSTGLSNVWTELTRTSGKVHARAQTFTIGGFGFKIADFLRSSTSGSLTNDLTIAARLRVIYQGTSNGSTIRSAKFAEYAFMLHAPPGGSFDMPTAATLASSDTSGSVLAFVGPTIAASSNAAEVNFAAGGANSGDPAVISYDLDYRVIAGTASETIAVVVP